MMILKFDELVLNSSLFMKVFFQDSQRTGKAGKNVNKM